MSALKHWLADMTNSLHLEIGIYSSLNIGKRSYANLTAFISAKKTEEIMKHRGIRATQVSVCIKRMNNERFVFFSKLSKM